MKNVLVTGGAGFVGFNLCKELLNKNYNITVIDNFSKVIKKSLKNKLFGPTFIHIKIVKGSIKSLGRPTIHPNEVSRRFQKFLEN